MKQNSQAQIINQYTYSTYEHLKKTNHVQNVKLYKMNIPFFLEEEEEDSPLLLSHEKKSCQE